MKSNLLLLLLIVGVMFVTSRTQKKNTVLKTISTEVLKDKIAGGWAGKMLGVSYGGPTEFDAHGFILEDSIKWKPSDVNFSLQEDDIYVQLTFMMTMDQYGIDAPAKKFQELFAKSGYKLWHANVQARKNYYDSIFPPQSGSPEFNSHADDIDFQIEADYIGLICPGMPQTANRIADKIGHIMNYGDGVYGGAFVAALYSEAYFESDMLKIVQNALRTIPVESDYSKIVNDVILLYKQYPKDWKAAWKELEDKWANTDMCGAGSSYNIDAKFNGAYIVMGLLYGDGDPFKTMDIATRCGQDSDCNPSNAMAVLGVVKGFSAFPAEYREKVLAIKDSLFINTNYSFYKTVEKTLDYAKEITVKNGGKVSDAELAINVQTPTPLAFEESFPNLVFDRRVKVSEEGWTFNGNWETRKKDDKTIQDKVSANAGDEAIFKFEGTGVSIAGNWNNNCGKADVFVDGQLKRTIDCYFHYSNQHPGNVNLYLTTNLQEGKHTVHVVVKGEKRTESEGANIYLSEAVVYKTGKKIDKDFKFSFQK
ncbi:MAG: ADP-ribosylglycohydrolase family protein [Prolixibacteraceae bacterium]|nr:ADP-ribosylglycohydrolase family protein [Prolixibacteraceae bacterium]